MPFFSNPYFYYISIGLQLICVIHCIRKGNTGGYWIWLIVFLPFIGCIAYVFTEIFTRHDIRNAQSGLQTVIRPGGQIKKLEANLRFSDTFTNRVQLADAYLQKGLTDKAIELYKQSLTDNFTENEYVIAQLILAYFEKKQFDDIVPLGKKLQAKPQFARSKSHIRYAIALSYAGFQQDAEAEFLKMKAKFSDYEARYEFGKFLLRLDRPNEAIQLFNDIVGESSHLTPRERIYNREWLNLSKQEIKRLHEA